MSLAYLSHTHAYTRFRGSCIFNVIYIGGVMWSTHNFWGVRFTDKIAMILKGLSAVGTPVGIIAYLLTTIRRAIRSPTSETTLYVILGPVDNAGLFYVKELSYAKS